MNCLNKQVKDLIGKLSKKVAKKKLINAKFDNIDTKIDAVKQEIDVVRVQIKDQMQKNQEELINLLTKKWNTQWIDSKNKFLTLSLP